MKYKIFIFIFFFKAFLYAQQNTEEKRGWYEIEIDTIESQNNTFIPEKDCKAIGDPILKLEEFGAIEIENTNWQPAYQVVMILKEGGKSKLEELTTKLTGKHIGFYLNNKLIYWPMITTTIVSGKLSIGFYDKKEREVFFKILRDEIK